MRREDAAGMGMLSLARRGCTVSSRPRNTDGSAPSGWRVELAPEHFLGEAEAEVHPDDGAPWPQGTVVTFQATESESADNIRAAIGTAAWHYPLPVVFENVPTTPAGGEELERRAFLDGALHAERWPGLVFGVFKDRWNGFGLNDPDVNFHGLTVSVRLPSVETVAGARWSVREHLNVLITGPAGVGKTWIACALAHSACRNGHSASYRRLPRLLTELAIARADGRYPKLLASIAKTEVLVIDDWGLAKLNAENRRDLLEIIEDRHGIRSTVATSQLPLEKWHDVVGDPTLADAILDRLVHSAYQLNLKGESMRKRRPALTQTNHRGS